MSDDINPSAYYTAHTYILKIFLIAKENKTQYQELAKEKKKIRAKEVILIHPHHCCGSNLVLVVSFSLKVRMSDVTHRRQPT